MTERHFVIPQTLVSALLTYLQTRPYQEVAQAIPALMNLPECKIALEETSEKPAPHNPDFEAQT